MGDFPPSPSFETPKITSGAVEVLLADGLRGGKFNFFRALGLRTSGLGDEGYGYSVIGVYESGPSGIDFCSEFWNQRFEVLNFRASDLGVRGFGTGHRL